MASIGLTKIDGVNHREVLKLADSVAILHSLTGKNIFQSLARLGP
jgi:hypothetical protein